MRKCILLFFCLVFQSDVFAQNRVGNPSFEDTISCPGSPGQIEAAIGWLDFGPSPDLFNTCATQCVGSSNCEGVPQNWAGYQFAYSGNSYAGLACYASNSGNLREYIGTHLLMTLEPGNKYYVSAYVCRADGSSNHGACNNFGFLFTINPHNNLNNYLTPHNYSHVNDSSIITDSIGWTLVQGSFIADSAYEYLAIGNFYDDAHTDTLDIHLDSIPNYNYGYYFIDEICVTQDSLNCNPILTSISEIVNRNCSIYPNPSTTEITIGNLVIGEEITISDIFGRRITNFITENTFIEINISSYQSGIYSISTSGGVFSKFVKE